MTVVIFKPSLTAATKVFNQCPVGGRFPQKVLAKPQAGQKTCTERCHFCLSVYQLPARRDREGYPHNQELSNQSCPSETQTAPDNLLVKTHRFGRAQNSNKIDVRGVKSSGQYRDVDQIAKTLGFKIFN